MRTRTEGNNDQNLNKRGVFDKFGSDEPICVLFVDDPELLRVKSNGAFELLFPEISVSTPGSFLTTEFLDATQQNEWREALKLVRSNDHSLQKELYFLSKSEKHIPVTLHIQKMSDSKDGMLIVVVHKLSDPTKIQKKLKKELDQKNLIFQSTEAAWWECNVTSRTIQVSDAWLNLLGRDLSQKVLSIEECFELCHPEDRDLIQATFHNHAQGKSEQFEVEYRIREVSGNYIWVLDRGKVIKWSDKGLPERFIGALYNITSRKEQLNSMMLQKKIELINSHPSATAMFDKNMNYLAASPLWYDIKNLPLGSVIGKSHYDVVKHADPDFWKTLHRKALNGEVQKSHDMLVVLPNGQQQWLSWEMRPWFGSGGEIGGIVIKALDVTDQILAKKQTEKLLAQTVAQNERLMNYAYIVSHNLRSHSGNISMLLDLMQIDHPEDTSSVYWGLIKKSAGSLSKTLERLSSDVKQNNLNENSIEAITLKPFILALLEGLEASFHNIDSQVVLNISDQHAVKAINPYLESALMNLVSNAIKYRRPNIELLINLSTKMIDDNIVIAVSDNGLGIDLSKHEKDMFKLNKTFHDNIDNVNMIS
ncbi:MAG: PAS domain-containing protein, partial [Flavobacteriales bacterium]